MEFDLDVNLVHSPKLILTPQLKQFFKILNMSYVELIKYIDDETQANPALEFAEIDSNSSESFLEEDPGDEMSNCDIGRYDSFEKAYVYNKDMNNRIIYDKNSLKDHLLIQLGSLNLNYFQRLVGEYLIDNTDENGYMTANIYEVAAFFNLPVNEALKILKKIQTFDPPGICARNLKECLLIQLDQMKNIDKNIREIVENYLEKLALKDVGTVSKYTGIKPQKIEEIISFIQNLDPKPGREFYNNSSLKYTIPDIIVKRMKEKYEVIYNEDSLPLISINKYYEKVLGTDINKEAERFIINRINNAKWFMKCLDYRKNILSRVAEYIVRAQEDFFKKGKEHLAKLKFKEISSNLNISESILCYAVNDKFIQCQWGVMDMCKFLGNKGDS